MGRGAPRVALGKCIEREFVRNIEARATGDEEFSSRAFSFLKESDLRVLVLQEDVRGEKCCGACADDGDAEGRGVKHRQSGGLVVRLLKQGL